MKQSLSLIILICLLSLTSCIAPKMAQTLNDVKKLEINEQQFIGKPLKVLLKQIKPKIRMALGNLDEISTTQSPFLLFHFYDKEDFIRRYSKKENPLSIRVVLQKLPGKSYPALPSSTIWAIEQVKAYGEMTVLRISVSGKD